MSPRDNRRSVYFPTDVMADIEAEARRQDRPVSWLLQLAWRLARPTMAEMPTAGDAAEFARRHYR